MDTSKTKLITETREINRAGIRAIAGPNNLDLSRKSQEPDAIPNTVRSETTFKYAQWGKSDKYPREVVDLNVQDTTSAACLNFKIKAHYGLGLFPYRKTPDGKGKEPIDLDQYPEIQDFLLRSDVENILQGSAADFEWWNWTATELIPDGRGKKILYANRIPVVSSRFEIQDKKSGEIENLYVSGDFGYISALKDIGDPIPILKKKLLYRDGGVEKYLQRKHVHVARQTSVDRVYYPLPMWQSNNKFLNLSLEISDWILSNINNSINIKYHIEYPQEYFEKLVPVSAYDSDAEWIAAVKAEKDKLFSEIDEYLAGVNNVGKYLHTYTMNDPKTGEKMGFKINILENKTNHEAYLPAFDTSAAAIANAHNAPLDLVGLSLSKGMGSGSGSNIRESFNFYMQLHTQVPRQTTLEWLHIVKKLNNWPKDIYFDYRNIVFQSMNENKSGYAIESEPTPTTDNK